MGPIGPWAPLTWVLMPVFILAMAFAIAILSLNNRRRLEEQRLQLHARLLDRVGSAKEFSEFLTTEQGQQFLASLSPVSSSPKVRIVRAVRGGIVVLFIGIALLAAGGSANWQAGVIVLLIGIGMLLSAFVSYFLASKLGLVERDDRTAAGAKPPSLG